MTIYKFKLNDTVYTAKGNNRFEAQNKIELKYGVSLKGYIFEEVYKLTVVRRGYVK